MQRLLITGGAGFIGANFVRYWRRLHPNDLIVVLDALTYAGNRANLDGMQGDKQFEFVHGDICDARLVQSLFRRQDFDLVVHFAAESHARFPRCPAAGGGSTRELITFVKDRPGHDRRYAICADKLGRELEFRAETALADGLRRTVDWYLDNERWWRAIQTGAYRDWMKLQYGAASTGSIN